MFGSSPCCFLARFQILAQILQLKLLCPCCVMLFEVQLVRAPAVCSRNALWNINFESEPGSTDPKIFQLMHCCTMLYHVVPYYTMLHLQFHVYFCLRHNPSKYRGKWENHKYFPSPKD